MALARQRQIGAVLEEWPPQNRLVLASFPAMSIMRQAVLLASIGDIACFRNDRQLRMLLGWYPEARESGSSLSRHRLSGNRMARRELWLWAWELITPSPIAILCGQETWFRSRDGSVVFVDQSTQAILPHDSAYRQRRHRGLAARRPLVQPLVWPCLLVVLNELLENVLQVPTTHDQQVV